MTRTRHQRVAVAAMYAGLGLTVVATVLLSVDPATTRLTPARRSHRNG